MEILQIIRFAIGFAFFPTINCDNMGLQSLAGLMKEKLSEMLGTEHLSPAASRQNVPEHMKDPKHGVIMGVSDDDCDNARDNLEVDWNGSPVNYTCFAPNNHRIPVDTKTQSFISCDVIPEEYSPQHHCMNEPIVYHSSIPTHEGHRPLWPVFGEYSFVPPQRWLHNIEHGAVVMLYHPCAEPQEVKLLRKLVESCLWKYVITPWNMLNINKPLALVAWGCRLEMSSVDPPLVRYFIRSKAFRGPEGLVPKQGQYTVGLLRQSEPPSDPLMDKVLC